MKKLAERLRAKGPFRAEDLGFAAQQISQDIQLAWDELGQETNAMRLAKPQNGLAHGIESLGPGAPLFLKVSQRCGVVSVQGNHLTLKTGKKTPDGEENSKKLAVVDGKVGAILRPQAGELVIAERHTPARVGGVR